MTAKYQAGLKISTRKGSVLTVESVEGKDIYVSCNVCNLDSEMFPCHFKTCSSSLNKGLLPCGCGNARLSEHQQGIRCSRLAKERGYVFEGFSEKYRGAKTRLTLFNPSNNNRWYTATYSGLKVGDGCPLEGVERSANKLRMPFTTFIENIALRDNVKKYYVITEDQDNLNYCNIYCPVCAEDMFSKAGLCTGNFRTRKAYLLDNCIPCRCSTSPKYTSEQKEFKVKLKVTDVNGKFLSFSRNTEVEYLCSNNHHVKVHYNSFVNDGDGCRQCYNLYHRSLGLYPKRKEDPDTLYVILLSNIEECFVKVGRSFNLDKRLRDYELAGYEISSMFIVEDTHTNIYDLEQEILQFFKDFRYKPLTYFKGGKYECLPSDLLQDIIDYTVSAA